MTAGKFKIDIVGKSLVMPDESILEIDIIDGIVKIDLLSPNQDVRVRLNVKEVY